MPDMPNTSTSGLLFTIAQATAVSESPAADKATRMMALAVATNLRTVLPIADQRDELVAKHECAGPWMPAPGYDHPYGALVCETHGEQCPARESWGTHYPEIVRLRARIAELEGRNDTQSPDPDPT